MSLLTSGAKVPAGAPVRLPCVPPGVKLTPVAGFFTDKRSAKRVKRYPSCGGVPSLSDMTSPTWLAGYDHGYSDGAATASQACIAQKAACKK